MKQNEEIVSENNEAPENVSETQTTAQESSMEKLQAELGEQKDKFIRLYSEFENFRRRTAKEKLDLIQSAGEHLIKMLLPVIDDFDRAEKNLKDQDIKELEGFFLIHNKFRKILDQSGVKLMEVDRKSV